MSLTAHADHLLVQVNGLDAVGLSEGLGYLQRQIAPSTRQRFAYHQLLPLDSLEHMIDDSSTEMLRSGLPLSWTSSLLLEVLRERLGLHWSDQAPYQLLIQYFVWLLNFFPC